MIFEAISIEKWRQFNSVQIDFHPRLTVITGANGAGKTTILNILSRHFGWAIEFVGVPYRDKSGTLRYLPDINRFSRYPGPRASQASAEVTVGNIRYSGGGTSEVKVPNSGEPVHQLTTPSSPGMNGIFIPSHRPAYIYRKVESIPTKINARTELLTNYVNELRNRFNIGARSQSPSFRIKEALISLAALGYGNDVVRENREAIDTFEGFQDVLRSILPKTMGFRRIAIELPEVVFETSVGNFSFDAVSGGISAIIDLGWQIYMASLVYTGPFVVIIDEPENHLHPTLQKALLPSLLEAFPKPQFIVATHNPLIISSTTESNIFVLNYRDDEERQEVFSERLDFVNRAGTSNEILRDVLGVEYASPNWVSDKVEALLKELSSGPIDEASLERLRSQLQDLGLAEYFPKALEGLLDKHAPT